MWKRRILWGVLFFVSVILYIFDNDSVTFAVCVAVALVPALFCALPLFLRKKIEMELALEQNEKGQAVSGVLTLRNRCILPASAVGVRLVCRNLLNGQEETRIVRTGLRGREKRELFFSAESEYCGAVSVAAASIQVFDIFGLTMREADGDAKAMAMVYPEIFETEVILADSASAMMESDNYSKTKSGNDPGETLQIREYVPGDSVKYIHWKLSQKTDRLMVRELGLPIVNQAVLLIETIVPEGFGAVEIDVLMRVFVSVAEAFCRQGLEYFVGWVDSRTGKAVIEKIVSEETFNSVLKEILASPVRRDGLTVGEAFGRQLSQGGFAHTVIVSGSPASGADVLENGSRVTLLLESEGNHVQGLQPDGTIIASFDKFDYEKKLRRLEV